MSTLVVSNISDGTTTVGASYVTNGSAKAWVNMNGTGTIAARDSFNVASLTDNGTGSYTINFSTAMANADYSPSSITQGGGTNASYGNINGGGSTASVLTTTAAPMRVTSAGSGAVDITVANYQFHGDLA